MENENKKAIVMSGITGVLVWLLMRKPVAAGNIRLFFWAEPSIVKTGSPDWLSPNYDAQFGRPGQIWLTVNGEDFQMTDRPFDLLPGSQVTIEARPYSDMISFVNWFINGQPITDNPYTFTPTESSEIMANFGYGG